MRTAGTHKSLVDWSGAVRVCGRTRTDGVARLSAGRLLEFHSEGWLRKYICDLRMFSTPDKPSLAGQYIPFTNSNMVADRQNSLPAVSGLQSAVTLPEMKKTVKTSSMLPEQLLAWQDEVQENASSHSGCWAAFTQPAPTPMCAPPRRFAHMVATDTGVESGPTASSV